MLPPELVVSQKEGRWWLAKGLVWEEGWNINLMDNKIIILEQCLICPSEPASTKSIYDEEIVILISAWV